MRDIDNFVLSGEDKFYIMEEDSQKRKDIHIYIKEKYGKEYISRSEYMAYGTEINCCDKWYKSSIYGESWNGGSIFCEICGNIQFIDYDDMDDIDTKETRFSDYKPTGQILICKKNYCYKKKGAYPFTYRKRYYLNKH